MDADQILAWCNEKCISFENAFVLSQVAIDISETDVYKVLDTVKDIGRTKVCSRRRDHSGQQDFVLVETSVQLSEITVPATVGIVDEMGPWPVHIVSELPPAPSPKRDDFQTKLLSFLQQEGKSLADIHNIAPPTPTVNAELVKAINSLVQKCNIVSPVETQSYRKLRTFSGLTPAPSGEDEYDVWAEHVSHILEEWQCSDSLKKQKLVECLRGTASDIVRFVKIENPSATSGDYLSALETAFGNTESASDLLVRYKSTFQEEGEKLSAYILKLDKLLHVVLRKKGIDYSDMNRLRIQQIIRGALPTDMVALRLRMTHKLREPPSFAELLKEVREEENMVYNRNTAKATVALSAVASTTTSSNETEIEVLKKEIMGLKSAVTQLSSAAVVPAPAEPSKLHSLAVTPSADKVVPAKSGGGATYFCYQCGEDGHFQRYCRNEENLRKVNQRLIKMTRPKGNFTGAQ